MPVHVRDVDGRWWDVIERVEFRRRASDLPEARQDWLYFLARDGGTKRHSLPAEWGQLDVAALRALLASAEWVHRSRGMAVLIPSSGRTTPETAEL